MTIVRTLEVLPHEAAVVTVGTFDGVHRGHRRLLEGTVQRARELGVRAVVVTFEPIPAQVLRPDLFAGRIATAEEDDLMTGEENELQCLEQKLETLSGGNGRGRGKVFG